MIEERYDIDERALHYERRQAGPLTRLGEAVSTRRERIADSILARLMLAMTCVATAGVLYLAQASQESVLQYNIAELQAQQATLNAENANLQATATQLQSLRRIDTAAAARLHMAKPNLENAIWVNAATPSVPQPAQMNADSVAAEQASQPLAWMHQLFILVQSSL